jgi:hypothetical protein
MLDDSPDATLHPTEVRAVQPIGITKGPTRMLAFIVLLVVLWIVLGVVGFLIKGLFWLIIIAVILFLASLFFGGRMSRTRR